MRGRKPKDLALKMLQGNPGKRPLAAQNPFTMGIPKKPADLGQEASEEWDRLTRTLAGILSLSDYGILRCACDAHEQMVQAVRVIHKHGPTYTSTNENGSVLIRQRPEVRMRENARRSYQLALSELGATPAGHTRVRRLPDESPSEKLTGVRRLLG
jgi:P27 family predicted phage terminase small subunit